MTIKCGKLHNFGEKWILLAVQEFTGVVMERNINTMIFFFTFSLSNVISRRIDDMANSVKKLATKE